MAAKQAKSDKPNILVIWGDDIGVHNVSAYHRGLMGGNSGIKINTGYASAREG